MSLHPACVACTNQSCVQCKDGYFLEKSHLCRKCTYHDPRCLLCDSKHCLKCSSDLPIHGYSAASLLALSERAPRNEPFRIIVNSTTSSLYSNVKICEQDWGDHYSWNCSSPAQEPVQVLCGHEGSISWSSSQYVVAEGATSVRLAVKRSGGGVGVVSVHYVLHHLTTGESDLTNSPLYSSSANLNFRHGVTELSFVLSVHDDRDFEGDEIAMVELIRPEGGALLGTQRKAVVTIVDDDMNRASAFFSRVDGDRQSIAGLPSSVAIFAHTERNLEMHVGGEAFLVELEPSFFSSGFHLGHLPYTEGSNHLVAMIADVGNGSYVGSWNATKSGAYKRRTWCATSGGLRGEYHRSSESSTRDILARVDAQIHFTWLPCVIKNYLTISSNLGMVVDFVRWTGRISPSRTDVYDIFVSIQGKGSGARLWLDGKLLIDAWRVLDYPRRELVATSHLEARRFHSVVLELRLARRFDCRHSTREAFCAIFLEWSCPSMSRAALSPNYLYSEGPRKRILLIASPKSAAGSM